MVYVIIDSEVKGRVMLVKAENMGQVEELLRLKGTQEIAGTFTDNEINVLTTSHIVVLSG